MACGCGKRRTQAAGPVVSGLSSAARVFVVWVNGEPTNRRFTSIIAARAYADALGGEVREAQ